MIRTRFLTGLLVATMLVSSFAPAVSAAFPGLNGKVAFHSNRTGNYEIYTMSVSGGQVVNLTNNPAMEQNPAWSPDGTKIAFSSTRDGTSQIYVMNANGDGVVRLSNNAFADANPAWSPDGTKIAFSSTRDGNNEIYVMNADGTNQTNITNSAGTSDLNPAWSPINNKVAYQVSTTVRTVNSDGTNNTLITPGNNPNWSPDGQKIVFNHNFGSGQDVYFINADTTGLTQVTTDLGTDAAAAWAPDGSQIVFRSVRDGNNEIYRITTSGTGEIRLTNNLIDDDTAPDWQPLTILPALAPDTAPSTTAGNSVTTNVLTNDTDTYESIDPSTLSIVSVSNGTATANPDGTITYQSVLGYSGTAQVTYRVCSTANPNLCNTSVLSISVTSAGQLAATGESSRNILIFTITLFMLSFAALYRYKYTPTNFKH